MFVGLWKLLTNEQSFYQFCANHGSAAMRALTFSLGEVLKLTSGNPKFWWAGIVLQSLSLGMQAGDKNADKSQPTLPSN